MVAPYEIGDPVRSYVRVPGSGSDKTAKSLCCDLSRVSLVAAAAPIPQDHVQEPQPTVSPNPQANENVNGDAKSAAETVEKVDANNNDTAAAKVQKVTESQAHTLPSSAYLVGDGRVNEGRKDTETKNTENLKKLPNQGANGSVEEGSNITEMKTLATSRKRAYHSEDESQEGTIASVPLHKQARMTSVKDDSSRPVAHGNSTFGTGIGATRCEEPSSSVGTQTESFSDVVAQRNQLLQQNMMLERRLAVFKDIFTNKQRLSRLLRCLEVQAQN